jgi:hypothetical protein
MSATTVRYRVKPGRAEENADLVRAVYAELAELAPPGFRYATFRDGDTFTHVAFGTGPLQQLAAFRRFREGLDERCEEPPAVRHDLVGAYGLEE